MSLTTTLALIACLVILTGFMIVTVIAIGFPRALAYLAARKRFWLLPAVITLIVCLLVIAFTEGSTP